MGPLVLPAIQAAGSITSALLSRRRSRGIHGKVRNISDRFRAERPVGYLTPEDYAYTERQRDRGTATIGALGNVQRGATVARQVARGLGHSPATEYLMEQANQREASGVTDLNRSLEDRLYGIRREREVFAQNQLMTAWGAELGALQHDQAGRQAQQAAFWNSMLPLARDASSYFSKGSQSPTTSEWENTPSYEGWSDFNPSRA